MHPLQFLDFSACASFVYIVLDQSPHVSIISLMHFLPVCFRVNHWMHLCNTMVGGLLRPLQAWGWAGSFCGGPPEPPACCCANNLQQTLTNELEFIARQFNSHQHLQFVNEAVCNARRVKMVLQGGVM